MHWHHPHMYRRWRRPFFRPRLWRRPRRMFWGPAGCLGCLPLLMLIFGLLICSMSTCAGPYYWY